MLPLGPCVKEVCSGNVRPGRREAAADIVIVSVDGDHALLTLGLNALLTLGRVLCLV